MNDGSYKNRPNTINDANSSSTTGDKGGNNKMNSFSNISIQKEMESSYIEYAMSVITGRALPDWRDGLKPVQRRILYAMYQSNNVHDKPYRKSAKAVGETMTNYHPHGDAPIYGALARLAQSFNLRIPLIDGQGNFGSIDGDLPAAMRYTEARLAKISTLGILRDLEYNTVEYMPNYDASIEEPVLLPARFPNVLVNGASGIAVGMATSIPTHNLGEVIDACCAYINDNSISFEQLLEYIPGPDFPTGGEILGYERLYKAMKSGRGTFGLRGKAEIESVQNRKSIIITQIPYQVNKSELIRSIENLIKEKKLDGITDIRDESNRLGIRIVMDLRKGVEGEILLNQIYKQTALETQISINMLGLYNNKPRMFNMLDVIRHFVSFRRQVVLYRTSHMLYKARERAHILIGLLIAIDSIDDIIHEIKIASDVSDARRRLISRKWRASSISSILSIIGDNRNIVIDDETEFTDAQIQAILEMRLQRLTGMEKSKLLEELNELSRGIIDLLEILESEKRLMEIIRDEMMEIRNMFATPRQTMIIRDFQQIHDDELVQSENFVMTLTKGGYIKRVPLQMYREQRRGGRGKSSISVVDDIVSDSLVVNSRSSILFFSTYGKVYRMKVYKLPSGQMQNKGKALVNFLNLKDDERITNVMPLASDIVKQSKVDKDDGDKPISIDGDVDVAIETSSHDEKASYLVLATARGNVRSTALSDFARIPENGRIACALLEGDSLVSVRQCYAGNDILLATKMGRMIRFPISKVRVTKSKTALGVRGIRLNDKNDDCVVSMSISDVNQIDTEIRDGYLNIPIALRIMLGRMLSENAEINLNSITAEFARDIDASDLEFIEKNWDILRAIFVDEKFALTITSNGYATMTSVHEYRITGRGGSGLMNVRVTGKNGHVVGSLLLGRGSSVMIVSKNGVAIRTNVEEIRITGRRAVGVRVMQLDKDDCVQSVNEIHDDADDDAGAV